jgi:hypothetical protein
MKKPDQELTKHRIDIEQRNGLFFVKIDGEQLTKERKARTHKAGITRPETFLTADSAYKAAEKELSRRRKLAASQPPVDVAEFKLTEE